MDDRLKKHLAGNLEAWADYQIQMYGEHIWRVLDKCESPIEKYMLISLAFMEDENTSFDTIRLVPATGRKFEELSGRTHRDDEQRTWIYPQVAVGRYRVDFLLVVECFHETKSRFIAIECDGHDFHEKTKRQAGRERAREREIQAAGITVLRFTGSEIFRDANRCASEVMRQIEQMRQQAYDDSVRG